jgi:hypothetical protein
MPFPIFCKRSKQIKFKIGATVRALTALPLEFFPLSILYIFGEDFVFIHIFSFKKIYRKKEQTMAL